MGGSIGKRAGKIDGYFLELAKSWENEQNITVRILRVNATRSQVWKAS